MLRIAFLAGLILTLGCRTYETCCAPKTQKWGLETGLATSVYPNAPYGKADYVVEKIDVSIKLKKEW